MSCGDSSSSTGETVSRNTDVTCMNERDAPLEELRAALMDPAFVFQA